MCTKQIVMQFSLSRRWVVADSGGMQGGAAPAADADQAQFEADKRAVYK